MGLVDNTIPGQRQTVAASKPLGAFGRVGQALLHLASCDPLPFNPWAVLGDLPAGAAGLVANLYQGKPHAPYKPLPNVPRWAPWPPDEGRRCVLAFSGGKDSVAQALLLQAYGYGVTLFHVHGINRGNPDELVTAQVIAELLGMPLELVSVAYRGAGPTMENRMKNQFIAGLQLDYAKAHGIGAISQGNYKAETLGTLAHSTCFTDAWENYEAWAAMFPVVEYPWGWLTSDSATYSTILRSKPTALPWLGSCIHPYRFRGMRQQQVLAKHGVQMPTGRCGVCYKCCLEYVMLSEVTDMYGAWQAGYALHCLGVIQKAWGLAYQAHLQPGTLAATLAAVVDQQYTPTPRLLAALA